jgi:hypothetical protein
MAPRCTRSLHPSHDLHSINGRDLAGPTGKLKPEYTHTKKESRSGVQFDRGHKDSCSTAGYVMQLIRGEIRQCHTALRT